MNNIPEKVTIKLGIVPGILLSIGILTVLVFGVVFLFAGFAVLIAALPFVAVGFGIWWIWNTLFGHR